MATLKLTEVLFKEIIPLLEAYDQTTACELVGITYSTLWGWRRQGKRDFEEGTESLFSRFYIQTQKARGKFKQPVIDSVRRCAIEGNPASTKMVLQAVDRKTWGDKVEVTKELDRALEMLKEGLTDDEYQKVLSIWED